jgi:inorganic pyrophosphatase
MSLFTFIDFDVHCETQPGEEVFIVGDHKDVGAWDEESGIKLETTKAMYPRWTTSKPWLFQVPESGLREYEIQYKICILNKEDGPEEDVRFEEIGGNRKIVVTADGAGRLTNVSIKFGEAEKEPIRIGAKFAPASRTAPKEDSEPNDLGEKRGSNSSMNSGMKQGMKKVESGCGLDYKMQAAKDCGKEMSFWHDIPLFPVDDENKPIDHHCNFVCEIPKTTRKKFEVDTKGVGNAIKQDTKNGKLREYSKGDIWFNYGCLPRTWEDTEYIHPDVGFPGDGDPLDACEIGMRMFATGEVRQTKVLGVICMIDEDETDWKLIVIDAEDRWAPELNDVDDVERLLPGALDQIREWWRTYKVTDGKPLNKFGLDEKFMPRDYAMEVIKECHHAWKDACAKADKPETGGMKKKNLSFSKLSEVDLSTDQAAMNVIGA